MSLYLASNKIEGASYEYPGYIDITVGNVNFAFGDVDGVIACDMGPADDRGADRTAPNQTIPVDSSTDEIVDFVNRIIQDCLQLDGGRDE